jgi:hypothetical protein
LGAVYKQVNAPFGRFAMDLLSASTDALASGSASDDSTYASIQGRIQDLTVQRDALALQMKSVLNAAAFANHPVDARSAEKLIDQGEELLERAHRLAHGDDERRDHDDRDHDGHDRDGHDRD